MSDNFKIEMSITELVAYIRKTPRKFEHELPDKLEKWVNKHISDYERITEELKTNKETPERKALRTDMALKILGNQNIHITTSPEHLAEYVVSLADAMLDQLEKTP